MTEQAPRASDQEITDTLLYIHEQAENVVPIGERIGDSSVYLVTKNLWSMDIRENCRFTVLEKHLEIRKPLDSSIDDPLGMKIPLHLDLPKGRHGDFILSIVPEGCRFFESNDYADPDNLSRRGLLRLFGAKDVQELWLAIKQRTDEKDVRKETTREITFYSRDTSRRKLYTSDKSTNGFVTSIFSSVNYRESTGEDIHLEGAIDMAWADGRQVLDSYTFSDGTTDSECALSKAKLLDIGSTVLSILEEHGTRDRENVSIA